MNSTIYIHWGFWGKLQMDSSREGIRSLLEISDILLESEVITDIPIETIKNDDFLKVLLLKGKQPSPCSSEYINNKIVNLSNASNAKDLSATYMLDVSSVECKNIEQNYGVIALCAESTSNRRYLFKGDGFSLDRTKKYSLRYLSFKEKLSLPCNAALIIDPYLLIDKRIDKTDNTIIFPGIENNLESLLSAILPERLLIDFHLLIMSSLSDPSDIKRVYEKIKKCLRRIRKDLSIKLGVTYVPTGYNHNNESFHSRHVETNTFALDSEDGLDLFDKNGYLTKNNPSVSIVFPRLFGDSRKDFTKYISWIRTAQIHIKENESFSYGETENRLFHIDLDTHSTN